MPDPTGMTVFSLMKARLQMLGERQKLISENVANVSTPGFKPRDVDQQAFSRMLEGAVRNRSAQTAGLTATQPGHISAPPAGGGGDLQIRKTPDSETTLDGNSVVVEEQMMKIAETRMDFETMVGLYQKSLGLLRMASRSPTR